MQKSQIGGHKTTKKLKKITINLQYRRSKMLKNNRLFIFWRCCRAVFLTKFHTAGVCVNRANKSRKLRGFGIMCTAAPHTCQSPSRKPSCCTFTLTFYITFKMKKCRSTSGTLQTREQFGIYGKDANIIDNVK